MNTATVYSSSNVSSTATESSSRLNWLDWMKAIGIVLIAFVEMKEEINSRTLDQD